MNQSQTKRNFRYYIVDVFGSEKYSGNQLCVFTSAENLSSEEMQSIAKEINFSETTFITGYNIDLKIFDVRIFTPYNEVPFAGHPTLGTAYIASQFFLDNYKGTLYLNLQVGKIPVRVEDKILWMNQIQPKFGQKFDTKIFAEILNIDISDIQQDLPIELVSTGLPFIIVPLKSLEAVKKAKPNAALIQKLLSHSNTKEIMVFSPEPYQKADKISSRVFVPELGIPEDAATGSANGCLSAYLLKNNVFKTDTINLTVGQGYEMNRPSTLYHKSSINDSKYNISIGGNVISVAEGLWY
jgi:trans-2,3-dihydro-3-hydroxyanthranilate isomerase